MPLEGAIWLDRPPNLHQNTPRYRHIFQETVLLKAARKGQTESVRVLVEGGANLNIMTDTGDFALYATTRWGHEDIIKLLLDHRVDTKDIDEEVWLQRVRHAGKRIVGDWESFKRERDGETDWPYFPDYHTYKTLSGSPPRPFCEYGI